MRGGGREEGGTGLTPGLLVCAGGEEGRTRMTLGSLVCAAPTALHCRGNIIRGNKQRRYSLFFCVLCFCFVLFSFLILFFVYLIVILW